MVQTTVCSVQAFAAAASSQEALLATHTRGPDNGTAETTTMPRRQLPEAQDEAQCLAHAGMEEKHTKASTQHFAAMNSFPTTHST